MYSIFQDDISKEVVRGLGERAFLDPGWTAALLQSLKDLVDMLSVFFLVLGENQNVVEVGGVSTVDVLLHDVVDKALECGWSVA